MKKLILLPVILLFVSNNAFLQAADQPSSESQKHIEDYGWIMGRQVVDGASAEFGFKGPEKEFFIKGFIRGAKNEGSSPVVEKEAGEKLQRFLEARSADQRKVLEAHNATQTKNNKEAAKAFFEKLDKEGKAKKTASGLYYIVMKEGSKQMPNEKSRVTVDYVGTLIDGSEFDNSKKRGQPATFNLEQVIPGFKEGLQFVGKGGSIKLFVPAELAYKDNDLPGIPPGSTLIFDVDMIDVQSSDQEPAKK